MAAVFTHDTLGLAGGTRGVKYVERVTALDGDTIGRLGSGNRLLPVDVTTFLHLCHRLWALQDPGGFQQLIDLIVQVTIDYLSRQIEAGAEAVQLFDSWAGPVPAAGFERWCIAPIAKIVAALKAKHPDVAVIAFPKGAGTLLDGFLQRTGADVLGIDHFTSADWARDNLQSQGVLQGNLDPLAVVAGGDEMINQARHIMETLAGKPHVFNLGHGFVPQTPPEHVEALSEFIKSWS